jgi:hypothetical protein
MSCPLRARKEGHSWRFTVIHGATGIAHDLCNPRSASSSHHLCKQGGQVDRPVILEALNLGGWEPCQHKGRSTEPMPAEPIALRGLMGGAGAARYR